MTVRGSRTQPFLMIAIQVTHKTGTRHAHLLPAIDVNKQSYIRPSRWGLQYRAPHTLNTIISQQPHSNLGWRNAPYPSHTYAPIPCARGIPSQHNNTGWRNLGTSNSDIWCLSETRVSEHNKSYLDKETVTSLRFLERPRTSLQSILQSPGTGRWGPGLVSTSGNWSSRQA